MLSDYKGVIKNGHDWECTAPDGGFYRWHCKKCGMMRPYPDPNPQAAGVCPKGDNVPEA